MRSQRDLQPINHVLGIGGVVGSMGTVGGTARAWNAKRFALQVSFSRDAMTSELAATRVTSVQVEPSVIYGLLDHVSADLWLRPYIGSGLSFRHQTLDMTGPAGAPVPADNGVGFQLFGGTELTLAALPRLGLSADVGYRNLPAPTGFDSNWLRVSIAAHWYIK